MRTYSRYCSKDTHPIVVVLLAFSKELGRSAAQKLKYSAMALFHTRLPSFWQKGGGGVQSEGRKEERKKQGGGAAFVCSKEEERQL